MKVCERPGRQLDLPRGIPAKLGEHRGLELVEPS
jgi:hypothetical protein